MEKYRATIQGDSIEWDDEAPADIADGKRVKVEVTVAQGPVTQSMADRQRAMEALQAIADSGGIKSIPDPVAWQREIRKDRPLPGRD